ncbi:MAG: helix-turn-helix domain-containing protein, partial [Caulobacter sp.]|nr:helix-turn-helix domain-containing protein [Caulobacter sp.]
MTTRASRLLHLLDDLRRRRRPVRGAQLAEQLGVSLRTLYRDIDALRPLSWTDLVARLAAARHLRSPYGAANPGGEASFDAGSAR